MLNYEDDPNVHELNDEFMLGDQMLVAPVVEQGARQRMIYLPKGDWYDFWTGEKQEGGRYFVREAPLDLCPIYVKAGTILPLYPGAALHRRTGRPGADTSLLSRRGCLRALPRQRPRLHLPRRRVHALPLHPLQRASRDHAAPRQLQALHQNQRRIRIKIIKICEGGDFSKEKSSPSRSLL